MDWEPASQGCPKVETKEHQKVVAEGRTEEAPVFVEQAASKAEEQADASPYKDTIEHDKGSMHVVGLHPLSNA